MTSASDWRQLLEVGNYAGERHVLLLDQVRVVVPYAGRISKVGGRRFAVVVLLEAQSEEQACAISGAGRAHRS